MISGEAPELALLRRDYPGWRMWRREDLAYVAWHLGTDAVAHAMTVAGLREQIEAKTGGTGDAG